MKTAKSRKGWINDPNLTYQAEPREVKLRKIINGEANNMEDGVFPTIYTEKKDGVQPEFDIRTDRFEVAIDAIDGDSTVYVKELYQVTKNITVTAALSGDVYLVVLRETL